jgi:hypothetical protein
MEMRRTFNRYKKHSTSHIYYGIVGISVFYRQYVYHIDLSRFSYSLFTINRFLSGHKTYSCLAWQHKSGIRNFCYSLILCEIL